MEGDTMTHAHDTRQGWKERYSLKEFRREKPELEKLATMLPAPVYRTKITKAPGFELLCLGIEYWKNEKVVPWFEYPLTEHEPVDHMEMIKNIFMYKGMTGLLNYIKNDVPVYVATHRRMFPELYATN